MEKREVSWAPVLIGLFLFFPVGLYFLAKKSETSTAAGTLLQVCGWFNAFMAFAMFSVMIDPEYATGGEGWGVLFFAAFTVLFIGIGFKNKRRIRRADKYIAYIKNNGIYSIDKMAELENTNYDAVLKDLKFIFSYSYLTDVAYLDAPNRVVVPKNMQQQGQMNIRTNQPNVVANNSVNNAFNTMNSTTNNTVSNTTTTTTSTGNSTTTTNTTTSRTVYGNTPNNLTNVNRTQVVRCSGCGANSTVTVGVPTECEYCGAPLNA